MSGRVGRIPLAAGAICAWASCLCAAAAVVSVAPNGCSLRQKVHIAAPPREVYEALIHPAKWWNHKHTFSNDAANLTLDARAGGCFCEKLPGGGSVQHMVVVAVFPGKSLTLRGALGPFQSQGVDGALSWVLTPAGNETDLTVTYTLGGYLTLPGGFEQWARSADEMIASQVALLQKHIERSPGK